MYNLLIGGAAGQGIGTTAAIVRKMLKKSGYNIFTTEDIMSRVRGGHNFTLIRFGAEDVFSHSKKIDGIIALNEETVNLHLKELNSDGFILCDKSAEFSDSRMIRIDMNDAAEHIGSSKIIGTVAAGAALKLFSVDESLAVGTLNEIVSKINLDINIKALQKGFAAVDNKFNKLLGEYDSKLLINGNQAVALGAIAANLKFYSAYPMSPSTSIMAYLSSKGDEAKVVVEQAEDEIAAINMAIGASYAGVRSMTGTSGGGFSLMVEALGFSGMAEIPVVIVDVQRPGPATGLPTRTEQSDLKFIISASQGEFPRMVIAIKNHNDAFYQTARAFYLAEKYQIPVVLLSDQYLADSYRTIEPYDLSRLPRKKEETIFETQEYLTYRYSEDGLSPRLIPGKTNHFVSIDSDEHNERGWITESAEVRVKMTDKRMKKLEGLKSELTEPEIYGEESFTNLLIGFGSTEGAIKEAVESLNNLSNDKYAALVFGDIYPLPKKTLLDKAERAERIINVEQNATGQLGSLIREQTGIRCTSSVLKYDGRQITADEIKEEVLRRIKDGYK